MQYLECKLKAKADYGYKVILYINLSMVQVVLLSR